MKLASSHFDTCDFEDSGYYGSFSFKPTNSSYAVKCSQYVQAGFSDAKKSKLKFSNSHIMTHITSWQNQHGILVPKTKKTVKCVNEKIFLLNYIERLYCRRISIDVKFYNGSKIEIRIQPTQKDETFF